MEYSEPLPTYMYLQDNIINVLNFPYTLDWAFEGAAFRAGEQ